MESKKETPNEESKFPHLMKFWMNKTKTESETDLLSKKEKAQDAAALRMSSTRPQPKLEKKGSLVMNLKASVELRKVEESKFHEKPTSTNQKEVAISEMSITAKVEEPSSPSIGDISMGKRIWRAASQASLNASTSIQKKGEELSIPSMKFTKQSPKSEWFEPILLSPKVTYGKLKTGFTYYILPNLAPSQRVYLKLVVKVGSIVEEDHEQGFAHLIEHLAFHSTESYGGNTIEKFMRSIGVDFGADMNAATSFDSTIYDLIIPIANSNLPKESESFRYMKEAIRILSEWATKVKFNEEGVNQEKKIVFEEWRLEQSNEKRIQIEQLKQIFKGSSYANRMPIGLEEIIRNCKLADLENFYKKWYNPHLMAVIVVGDFKDSKIVLDLIKEFFEEKQTLPNLPSLQIINRLRSSGVLDTEKVSGPILTLRDSWIRNQQSSEFPYFYIAKNPEASNYSSITLIFRLPDWMGNLSHSNLELEKQKFNVSVLLVWNTVQRVSHFGSRNETADKFVDMNVHADRFTRTMLYFEITILITSGSEKLFFELLLIELEKMKRHPMSETELAAVISFCDQLSDNELKESVNITSKDLSKDLVDNFLYNECFLHPETSREYASRVNYHLF